MAGALFVAFPASVEAVVWPAAIHDLIVAACALGFVLLATRRRSGLDRATAILLLVVALLSKESAVAIPLLAAVVWLRPGKIQTNGALPLLLIGTAVCVVYGVLRMVVVAVHESFAQDPTRSMLKELIARPIGTLTIPWNTWIVQSWPVVPFFSAVTVIAAAAAYAWRRTNALSVQVVIRCIIGGFVAVLPVYSMLFITADLENARYLYLSTAFWVIALVAFASPLE